jgi:hypothetical protein
MSRAPQMKKRSGARTATPLIPVAANRWVAIEKIITPVHPVQKMEQRGGAIKRARKNHFIAMSVIGMLRQQSSVPPLGGHAPSSLDKIGPSTNATRKPTHKLPQRPRGGSC